MTHELVIFKVQEFCLAQGFAMLEMARTTNTLRFKLGHHVKTEGNSKWDAKYVLELFDVQALTVEQLNERLAAFLPKVEHVSL